MGFAADNPPPPPEKGAQHQGKPPVKNGQHEGKQAQYNSKQPQRDGKQPQHDGKQPQHDGKQPQHDGKQPPHNGKLPPKGASTAGNRCRRKGASTAGNRCRRKRNTLARPSASGLFHPSSAIVDKLLPFFEMPEKKACIAPDIVCPRHCSVEKRYVKEKHKRPAVAVRIIFRASVGPSSGTRVLSGAKSRTAAAARSG